MQKLPVFLCFSLILASLSAWGQANQNSHSHQNSHDHPDETRVELEHMIELKDDSKVDQVTLTIPENTQRMDLKIYGKISAGKLVIELYDPSGSKRGTFSLATKGRPDRQSMANGNLSKSLRDPEGGNWAIKVMPSGATGQIHIRSAYIQ